MPAPDVTENYIRIRVKDAVLFVSESLRTIVISANEGIKAVSGKLKSEPNGSMVIQSYMFEKDKWTEEEALKWVAEHKKMNSLIFENSNEIIDFSDDIVKDSEPIGKKNKTFDCESKDFDDETMSFVATASTEDIDRDGDILLVRGWKLKNYKKNPVVLWQHDANLLPIARASEVWTEDKKLKFKPVFMSADINPFAQQVYRAYKKKFLTSFSVRFDPIEWEDMPADDKDTTNLIRRGRKYKSHELLEISAVNIPANPQATKSPEMIDFIVKSYMFQNKSDTNLDLQEIYKTANDNLKIKIDKLMELKELKEKHLNTKKIQEIENWVDTELAILEKEIETENKKLKLERDIKELKAGITRLQNK